MKLPERLDKVSIILPAFNEAQTISQVISAVSIYGKPIVVNDGSTDKTEQLARSAGALIVSHDVNLGYDEALASGLARAVAEEFEFAIIIDADGQHDPSQIYNFLQELLEGADLVVGIRKRFQRISESLFAFVASILWGIKDPLCGMKGYRLSRLTSRSVLSSYSSIGTELTIRAARSGWNIRQVPVPTRNRRDKSRFGDNMLADVLIIRSMLMGLCLARSYESRELKLRFPLRKV